MLNINCVKSHNFFRASVEEGRKSLSKETPFYIHPGASEDRFLLYCMQFTDNEITAYHAHFFIVDENGYTFQNECFSSLEKMLYFYKANYVGSPENMEKALDERFAFIAAERKIAIEKLSLFLEKTVINITSVTDMLNEVQFSPEHSFECMQECVAKLKKLDIPASACPRIHGGKIKFPSKLKIMLPCDILIQKLNAAGFTNTTFLLAEVAVAKQSLM